MSCITKLLEIKGEKEFLVFCTESGIEGGGIYKNHAYLISFNLLGHRCGYVAVPYGKEKEYEDLDCHGGITFDATDHGFKNLLEKPCNDLWIGFDAAHFNDLADLNTSLKYFGHIPEAKHSINLLKACQDDSRAYLNHVGCQHRSYEYMEKQCHYLIDQLIEGNHESNHNTFL